MYHFRGRLSDRAHQRALSGHYSSISTGISLSSGSAFTEHSRDVSWWKRLLLLTAAPRKSPEPHYWGNIQVLLSLNRRRGWEWEEFCSLPTPFVFLLFSQLQPHPNSEEVTDSSQNLPTWPLSMGITRNPPGPGPDGKKYSATLANKSTY